MSERSATRHDRGVLYASTGKKYVNEVLESARTLQKHTSIHCSLITDEPVKSDVLDRVILSENPDHRPDNSYKLSNIHQTPYTKTLYLDSDTYLTRDIIDAFSILDNFDIALTHAPIRNTDRLPEIPSWFPEYNCGVMLFNDNDTTQEFFEQWRSNYEAMEFVQDQPAFRKTLYESDIDYFTMLREYNVRFWPGYVNEAVRIVHTRFDNETIARRLEATEGSRAYHYRDDELQIRQNHKSLPKRVRASLRRNGVVSTVQKAFRTIADTLMQ